MRSGHIGRLALVATGAMLLTGACAKAPGLAGVSAQAATTASASGTPEVTATTPTPVPTPSRTPSHQEAVRPKGEDPVRVPPPKVSSYSYVFPVRGCRISYQRKLLVLPKTTIWAAKGCPFVAPVSGVVDEVNGRNKWRPSTDAGQDREGRFVTIVGDDGVRYLGGHLDTIADGIKPGTRVSAGQTLGTIGKSGNARDAGTNLYFAISWKTGSQYWWVRRGMVNPWNYLDAWLSGNPTLSPRDDTFALRARVGETPKCAVQCKSKKKPQSAKTPTPEPSDAPTAVIQTTAPSRG
ncbi:M23 family metallopeptidase [Nonomuraea sp. NPDC050536]|uniref:M23 family metallopeptidase n=1 Tax=Nonomuraea sp. NPDC050536 TaxID=3364366 RepID=UPI0037C77A50